jgi:ketosteroid isomerase-like protein
MPEGNTEVVRSLYEAMNERDVERANGLTHPDVEWESDPRLGMVPLLGRDAVIGFFQDQAQTFEDLRVEVERLSESGEKVLAFLNVTGRGRASGAAIDISIAHVWTLADGVVIHGEGFGDRDAAVHAAGLTE